MFGNQKRVKVEINESPSIKSGVKLCISLVFPFEKGFWQLRRCWKRDTGLSADAIRWYPAASGAFACPQRHHYCVVILASEQL